MYYKPTPGILFPPYKFIIKVNFDEETSKDYEVDDPELIIERSITEERLKLNAYSMINMKHVSSIDADTYVDVHGWEILTHSLLDKIKCDEGQKYLMSKSMNLECKNPFSRMDEFMNMKKKYKYDNYESDDRG